MTSSILNSLSFPIEEKSQTFLLSEQQKLLPTQEDVVFFQEHGWFVSPKVLADELIDFIFATTEDFYQGARDAKPPVQNCCNWQSGDQGGIRNNEYISFQKHEFQQLALQPIIGAIAARLMDTDEVRYFQDQLISKEPSGSNNLNSSVGWHTDRSYHSNCTSEKLLTVWIPLHDVRLEHGPLVMVDRSHRWSKAEHMRGFNHDNHQKIEQEYVQQGKEFNKIPILLKKGQISFHHSSIIHGSFDNNSNMLRRVVVINLQDGTNRYQTFLNNGKQIHHCLDSICRRSPSGLPDYSDPAVFPVIWSEK